MLRKAALIATLIVEIALIGGYFWYPTTPIYSLVQVSNAIENHDYDTFSRYVDIEKLSMELAKEITYVAYQVMDEKGVPSFASKNLAVALGTRVKGSLGNDMKTWIISGQPPRYSVLGMLVMAPQVSKAHIRGIYWRDGKAKAKIGADKNNTIELELLKENGIWRIIRVGNVRELYDTAKGNF